MAQVDLQNAINRVASKTKTLFDKYIKIINESKLTDVEKQSLKWVENNSTWKDITKKYKTSFLELGTLVRVSYNATKIIIKLDYSYVKDNVSKTIGNIDIATPYFTGKVNVSSQSTGTTTITEGGKISEPIKVEIWGK